MTNRIKYTCMDCGKQYDVERHVCKCGSVWFRENVKRITVSNDPNVYQDNEGEKEQ